MSLLRRIGNRQRMIRIVVIGKCEIIADGQSLTELIQQQSGLQLVGEFEIGQQAIEKTIALFPDIVIVDMTLSDMDGLAAITHIREKLRIGKYVLALTSNHLTIAESSIVEGPNYFLVKPILQNDFIDFINDLFPHYKNYQGGTIFGATRTDPDLNTGIEESDESKLEAMRQRRQAPADHYALNRPKSRPIDYSDLKTRIQNRLRSELSHQARDVSQKSEVRTYIEELFTVILAEENIILSRAERTGLFESIVSEILSPSKGVQFSCYYPREVIPNQRFGLHFYAHLQSEDMVKQVEQDVEKFRDELGGKIAKPKIANQIAQIETGMMLTIIPECEDLEFDPPQLSKKWHGDWTRFSFDIRAKQAQINDTLFVRVSVQVAGIEIAQIKCAIEVANAQSISSASISRHVSKMPNTSNFATKTVSPYQRIFISYSHKDSKVAQLYKTAQVALGNEVFLDVDSLRSGENWKNALAKAIDSADILQLFWSEHSANSEYCRYEWDYAFQHKCPDNKCEEFIRPVYWQQPMPPPPLELEHLNFKYAPFKDEISS